MLIRVLILVIVLLPKYIISYIPLHTAYIVASLPITPTTVRLDHSLLALPAI